MRWPQSSARAHIGVRRRDIRTCGVCALTYGLRNNGVRMAQWMHRSLSVATIAMLIGVIGCAQMGEPVTQEALLELQSEEAPRWYYGYGFAQSREDARANALSEVAETISVAVQAHAEQEYRMSETADGADAELEVRSTVSTTVRAIIDGAESEERLAQETVEGWFVQVRVPESHVITLRQKLREQAPVLARIEVLERLAQDEGVERATLAGQALDVARERGVETDRFVSESRGATTFDVYLNSIIHESLSRIKIIPIFDGGEVPSSPHAAVRFMVMDRETYKPQTGASIRVNRQHLKTGDDGYTQKLYLSDFLEAGNFHGLHGLQIELATRKGGRQYDLVEEYDVLDMKTDRVEVYFYTNPQNALARIDGRELVTPGVATLEAGNYQIEFAGGDTYDDRVMALNVPENVPYYHVAVELEEKAFGSVEISVQGDGRVTLDGPEQAESGRIEGALEAGDYEAVVYRPTREEETYQKIRDQFTLLKGEHLRREYYEPPDRTFATTGSRYYVSLAGHGEIGGSFNVPNVDGNRVALDEFGQDGETADVTIEAAEPDGEVTGFGLGGQLFSRWNGVPLTGLGLVGIRSAPVNVEYSDSEGVGRKSEVDIRVIHADLGVGLWRPIARNFYDSRTGALWAAGGLSLNSVRWDSDDAESRLDEVLPEDRVVHGYPFAALGVHYGMFGLSATLPVASDGMMLLQLEIGPQRLRSQVDRSSETRARRGLHYE